MDFLFSSFSVSLLSLLFAGFLAWQIKKQKSENEEAKKIASYIKEGAKAFLKKQYSIIGLLVLLIALLLWIFLPHGWQIALCFFTGATFSILAGNLGMLIATSANHKTAWAAKESLVKGLKTAFSSGSVMGLTVVGLGVLGISFFYWFFQDPQVIYGFAFGASFVALFARVGGGIYTKAADVGADIVGKVEKNIPEDDPRNPAVIADLVGDNVGDVAGMGADLFESYVASIVSAMVLGVTLSLTMGQDLNFVLLPLFLAALGILASILGNIILKFIKKGKPQMMLNVAIFSSALIMTIFTFIVTTKMFDQGMKIFWAVFIGLAAGIIIGLATEFFTSYAYQPTKKVAASSQSGAGPNLINGFALGMQSTVVPIFVVSGAIILSYQLAGLYGIALAAVGMLSTLGVTLATDCYGPVADNAAGISEMAHLGKEVREKTEQLDAVGNTTAAIGKGFAIGSAALTALVLSVSFSQVAKLEVLNLNQPIILVGIFLGGFLPFFFSSLTLRAVSKTAYYVVNEVRRQFREIAGLFEGKAKADYSRCVNIVTNGALKEMILPGSLAILAPLLVGFLLGKEALGGLLVGAIVSGFLLAITMANAGATWDNAKKYIEAGNFGGKGSEAHKAAVIGDVVGDPFKDTAGPSLNILIKLMSIISLIIAPLL